MKVEPTTFLLEANERKKRKERSSSVLAVKSLTNCSAVDPRRHALHESLADFRQRLARIELSCQTNAAEAAERVDVALRAEILNRLDAGDQTHLRSTNSQRSPHFGHLMTNALGGIHCRAIYL